MLAIETMSADQFDRVTSIPCESMDSSACFPFSDRGALFENGDLIKGHTRLIVKNGEIDVTQMRKSHLSSHDLHEAMRLHANVDELAGVKAAYKERSGEISIVTSNAHPAALQSAPAKVEP
jgi:hypothetical protein